MIVDDHELVRSGLQSILRLYDDIELVAQADSGAARRRFVRRGRARRGAHGPRHAGHERRRGDRGDPARATPRTRVLALTSFSDEALIEDALRAGAIGYLLKNITGEQLAAAIRAAYAGRSTLAPEAAEVLIRTVSAPEAPGGTSPGASSRSSPSSPTVCRTPTSPTAS